MSESRILLDSILQRIEEFKEEFPKERLEALLKKLNHTLDFGCYFAPTAWIKHSDQLLKEKQLLEKIIELY